jgi:hypothetical protein
MDLKRTISEKTGLAAIVPDQRLRIRIDAVPPNVSHAYPAGHVRVSETWVPVRRDPPKTIAHHPILVERSSCPQRPRDCNYGGKANHASEADQHDVEIIAWNLRRPTPVEPSLVEPSLMSAHRCSSSALTFWSSLDRVKTGSRVWHSSGG